MKVIFYHETLYFAELLAMTASDLGIFEKSVLLTVF